LPVVPPVCLPLLVVAVARSASRGRRGPGSLWPDREVGIGV